jgi:hypothetical protein
MALSNAEKQRRFRKRRDAHQRRLRVAENILRLFEEARGRPARTNRELERWVTSPKGRAALSHYRGKDGKLRPK